MNYFQKLKHRGPDHTGYLQKDDQFFGCHRLSNINPKEGGNQPLVLGDSILICNGQIYNYLELANKYKIPISELRTDVDIILQLYHQDIKMEEIGKQLDGVFAFVLYDIYRKFQKFHKKSQNETLEEKEKCEKLYYLDLFNQEYPGLRHLIPERKLPDWCSEISQNKNKKVLET